MGALFFGETRICLRSDRQFPGSRHTCWGMRLSRQQTGAADHSPAGADRPATLSASWAGGQEGVATWAPGPPGTDPSCHQGRAPRGAPPSPAPGLLSPGLVTPSEGTGADGTKAFSSVFLSEGMFSCFLKEESKDLSSQCPPLTLEACSIQSVLRDLEVTREPTDSRAPVPGSGGPCWSLVSVSRLCPSALGLSAESQREASTASSGREVVRTGPLGPVLFERTIKDLASCVIS